MARYTLPPRQKMINLLYVILLAILAINVSSDALLGYNIFNDNYTPRVKQLLKNNDILFEKVCESKNNDSIIGIATSTKQQAEELVKLLEDLKDEFIKKANSNDGNIGNYDTDLTIVPEVMLNPVTYKAKYLKKAIDDYKTNLINNVGNENQKELIALYLDTESTSKGSWEKNTFEYLPLVGGQALLNKMQEDVLLCAQELYRSLHTEEEIKTEPEEKTFLTENEVETNTEVQITPTLMKILYAGYRNPLSVMANGIPTSELKVTMTNGTVEKDGNKWIAIPNKNAENAIIHIMHQNETLSTSTFLIKQIPTPTAYLKYTKTNGQIGLYKGNVPFNKDLLLTATEVIAFTPELETSFKVVSFETILIKEGNKQVSTEHTNGNRFAEKQMKQIGQLSEGDSFYITSIMVTGPDGIQRQISPINVIVI